MPMERSNSSRSTNSSFSTTSRVSSSSSVLSIQCLKGSSKSDEWTENMLQTGDIVESLRLGNMILKSPFKNGKNGIQKIMHTSFKAKETSICVRVRRGSDESFTELQACIVPNEFAGRKQYMLRAIDDPNYAVGFVDRTEMECLELQASRKSRMVTALTRTPLQEGYVSYPWEKRMNELLAVPNSSSFYSLLLLPKASDKVSIHYNDLEDTLSRANAWLNASQASGVPIVFMNIQTESLLTKISGETASCTVNAGSLSDLTNLANASLYGFEDYHGVDIGVVRAVRLWFSPLGGEIPIEIKIKETDVKLGFAISRTEEGFIHISSVIEGDEDTPSSRSGLINLYKEAAKECKLLVVSRISNQKVLPWIVSPTGAVRCFDTVSLSQKLSLHRHAKVPILMHVFLWDRSVPVPGGGTFTRSRNISPTMLPPLPPEVRLARQPNENQVMPLPPEVEDERGSHSDGSELRLDRDTAGESSFRFHDFSLPNNWV
ncbi:uncharacterized protein LOC107788073 [Nicotiana tabacum]|uniref:Uncharacterized protein LOC107788073 n=1 Tax=Nicotiana tabacum TaxID=4097 RepID=A0A1S3ZLM9_TOBAC|nr:PREDICTED: uncharacterized protein LOC107788073 [Nicotiana tabacum]